MCLKSCQRFVSVSTGLGCAPYLVRIPATLLRVLRMFLAFMGLSLLGACTVGPDFKRSVTVPPDFLFGTAARDTALHSQVVSAQMETMWWKLFNDEILSTLEARAQNTNLDLQLAATRVAQSRARLGVADAAGFPRLGMSMGYAREAISANGPMAKLGAHHTPHDLWQGGFDSSWEIDLWGYARRTSESAAASMQASVFQQEGVRVSIAAEVARTYLLLRSVQTQLDITAQNQTIAEQAFKLAKSRVDNGVATRFESASAGAHLASVKALTPKLEEQRDALMNALALLLGEAPRALNGLLATTHAIPPVPQQVPVGLPSELARRRPDILQAEAQLHAATAAIGIAKADFYPRIRLLGNLGLQSLTGSEWGIWSSRFFSVGPTLYLPLFEGGRLKGTLALNEARGQEAALFYRQTVLRAWHEVDDALSAYAAVQRRNEELTQAFQQNRQAYEISLRRYEQGAADYLMVLTAQRSLLASQMDLSDNTSQVSLSMVSLYKALGGGWAAQADNAGSREP
jgi:NodT family efflux transporter outer membrane factor (OMF) lipoprotein